MTRRTRYSRFFSIATASPFVRAYGNGQSRITCLFASYVLIRVVRAYSRLTCLWRFTRGNLDSRSTIGVLFPLHVALFLISCLTFCSRLSRIEYPAVGRRSRCIGHVVFGPRHVLALGRGFGEWCGIDRLRSCSRLGAVYPS